LWGRRADIFSSEIAVINRARGQMMKKVLGRETKTYADVAAKPPPQGTSDVAPAVPA
jgi:hypothetical protein